MSCKDFGTLDSCLMQSGRRKDSIDVENKEEEKQEWKAQWAHIRC
jgi:hypothetical protein